MKPFNTPHIHKTRSPCGANYTEHIKNSFNELIEWDLVSHPQEPSCTKPLSWTIIFLCRPFIWKTLPSRNLSINQVFNPKTTFQPKKLTRGNPFVLFNFLIQPSPYRMLSQLISFLNNQLHNWSHSSSIESLIDCLLDWLRFWWTDWLIHPQSIKLTSNV